MKIRRKTIANIVGIEGVGLHSGMYTKLELHPAGSGDGIQFVRTDLRNLRIPAVQASTTALDYATSVGKDDISVGTVEHLLSALLASGITDIDLMIDGPEVPVVDGSALPFAHLIDAAGIRELDEEVAPIRVSRAIEVRDGDKTLAIEPADRLIINYSIEFDHPMIRRQECRFVFGEDDFVSAIAPARTFGFMRDVDKLRSVGLARGGSVENCVVLDDEGVMNGPLRFADEFVRHKMLDLVGDLALLGRPIMGKITAHKAGHALHSRLVEEILRDLESQGEVRPAETRRHSAHPA